MKGLFPHSPKESDLLQNLEVKTTSSYKTSHRATGRDVTLRGQVITATARTGNRGEMEPSFGSCGENKQQTFCYCDESHGGNGKYAFFVGVKARYL